MNNWLGKEGGTGGFTRKTYLLIHTLLPPRVALPQSSRLPRHLQAHPCLGREHPNACRHPLPPHALARASCRSRQSRWRAHPYLPAHPLLSPYPSTPYSPPTLRICRPPTSSPSQPRASFPYCYYRRHRRRNTPARTRTGPHFARRARRADRTPENATTRRARARGARGDDGGPGG